MQLHPEEYPEYFGHYISLANNELGLSKAMKDSFAVSMTYLESVAESKKDFAYQEGKWTVGQVYQHLIDVELVMAHRAFRISRKDQTILPGFDHNTYAEVADVSHKSLADMCKELKQVRNVTNIHFEHLNEKALMYKGTVSGNTMSVRALGYIMIGHVQHHINILQERYI